jgi:eukaryotic-like serine/threonine-protein kinase
LPRHDPERIGDYRLAELLGQGGQGMVYRALSPSGGDVAVKVLHAQMSGDPDAHRRFFRQVDLARRVAPFCTARVLDMGLHDDRPYIVSEYVSGASLDHVVRNDGPRSGSGLDRLAVATATALAAIHRAGVVHRDFKPSNVILGPEGPVVIDFGISLALDHTVTRSGSMGTPGYMAPEQISTGPVGQAADVFSWAATMAYAATGQRAFPGDSIPVLLHAILHRDPDLSGLPAGLRSLVAECLAKDPDSRPTAADLVRTLTGDGQARTLVARTVTGEAPAPTGVGPGDGPAATAPSAPPVPTRPIRRRVLIGAGAAMVALGTAFTLPSLLSTGDANGSPQRADTSPTGVAKPSQAPAFGAPVGSPLTDHMNDVRSVAIGRLDGKPVAVTGSDDQTARMWDLDTGARLGAPLAGHTGWVRSVALGEVDGVPVAVTGSDDHTVRVWDLHTGKQVGAPLTGHTDGVKSVAAGKLDGVPIAVSAGADGTTRVWDLRTRKQLGGPLTGHVGKVWAVAIGEVGGVPVAVTTGDDKTVRVWNLATRNQLGASLTGHTGWVRSVAVGDVGGVPVAVTGSEDKTVRVWNLATRQQLGAPLRGHTGWIWSVALGEVDGAPVAISGSEDKTVRVWNLTTRKELGAPLTGHTDSVWTVAFGRLGGRSIAVTGSRDETVREWNLGPPYPS